MGPKKQTIKNPYYFYMQEYIEMHRKKGRNISLPIAAEECSGPWQKMSPEEKKPYQDQAVSAKAYDRGVKIKYTSQGRLVSDLEREQKAKADEEDRMDKEISNTVLSLQRGTTLNSHFFYIVHCNYYCRTRDGVFIPAELAIVQFNLQDGIGESYHSLIDPVSIPLGYASEAMESSTKVHSLPQPPYEGGEKDLFKILDCVTNLLRNDPNPGSSRSLPPLYTIDNNLEATRYILNKFLTGDSENNTFHVYPLAKLFYVLKNHCVDPQNPASARQMFPLYNNAVIELDKDLFRYAPNICCKLHKEFEDTYHNCSLQVVQRMVYVICDHCCQLLDIPLHSPRHCPPRSDLARSATASAYNSAAPSYRSVRTASDFGDFEDDVDDSEYGHPPPAENYNFIPENREPLQPLMLPRTDSQAASGDYEDAEEPDVDERPWLLAGRGKRIAANVTNYPSIGRGVRR